MFEEWDKLYAVHYDRKCDNFIANYSKSIVDTLCLLECKTLYTIKIAYHIGPAHKMSHRIYEKIHSNFTGESFITLYQGDYPNIQRYQINDINCTRKPKLNSSTTKEFSNVIQNIITSLYRFNQKYATNFYKEDIETLRGYLDVFDNKILDIDLKSL